MIEIIAIRHGITSWNQQKKVQGHTDIPLAAEGIEVLKSYCIPAAWHERQWLCSPLIRAQQTAQLLGLDATPEPGLIEMSWGDWEGETVEQLRATYGKTFTDLEAKGLDMLPLNGESPRMVQQRLKQWIQAFSQQIGHAEKIGIVAHKGVIRAMLAAACDWDMTERHKPPVKMDYQAAHRFGWTEGSGWELLEANIQLLRD